MNKEEIAFIINENNLQVIGTDYPYSLRRLGTGEYVAELTKTHLKDLKTQKEYILPTLDKESFSMLLCELYRG